MENEIGYGKPPKQTQYKKGQSGNPKGRPKGSKNLMKKLDDEFRHIMEKEVSIKVNGKTVKTSGMNAVAQVYSSKLMRGDVPTLKALLAMLQSFPAVEPNELRFRPTASLFPMLEKMMEGADVRELRNFTPE